MSASLVSENIDAMWSRLPAPCRKRAVWLVGEDVESAVSATTTAIGTAGAPSPAASALYLPYDGSMVPHLKGRPVIAIEQAPAVGQLGDIVLADLTQYILMERSTRLDLSTHLHFDLDVGVFRFTLRVDGAPAWTSPITPWNGTQTRSPFVALATRT